MRDGDQSAKYWLRPQATPTLQAVQDSWNFRGPGTTCTGNGVSRSPSHGHGHCRGHGHSGLWSQVFHGYYVGIRKALKAFSLRSPCAGDALDPPLWTVPNKALSLSLSRCTTQCQGFCHQISLEILCSILFFFNGSHELGFRHSCPPFWVLKTTPQSP